MSDKTAPATPDLNDFDLDDFTAVDKPAPLILLNPNTGEELTNKGEKIILLINGPESQIMRDYERSISNRRLKTLQTTGRLNMDADLMDSETMGRLAKSVAGWSENFYIDKQYMAYTPQNAAEIIRTRGWIRAQVAQFVAQAGNFSRSKSRVN